MTKHAKDYLLFLQSHQLSERTIRNQAVVIKAALKSAFQQGYLLSERLYGWKISRMARASVYMPDHAEVGSVLDAILDAVQQDADSAWKALCGEAIYCIRVRRLNAEAVASTISGMKIGSRPKPWHYMLLGVRKTQTGFRRRGVQSWQGN